MVVRLTVVVKVKMTGAGLELWQVLSQCVAVLQRRTLDARLVHHYHHHFLLNPMTRMKMRTETETTLWLVVLSRTPP